MIKEVFYDKLSSEDISKIAIDKIINKIILIKNKAVLLVKEKGNSFFPTTTITINEKAFYTLKEYRKNGLVITNYYKLENDDVLDIADVNFFWYHQNDVLGLFNQNVYDDDVKSYNIESEIFRHYLFKNNLIEKFSLFDKFGNKLNESKLRGEKDKEGKYIKIVFSWIKNSKNEFLIQKRSAIKPLAGMWSVTGGGLTTEDVSDLDCAIREAYEELGVILSKDNAKKLTTIVKENIIIEVWLFLQDVDLTKLSLQLDEVSDARFINKNELLNMIENQTFYTSVNVIDMI